MLFSIIIPTWNNLDMVKLCVQSIRKNSAYPHEIVLHINDGNDGTRAWAIAEGIVFTASPQNIGICRAVNLAFDKTTKDFVMYMNDDMYVLPDWDTALAEEITLLGDQEFMLSSTMFEPESASRNVIVVDYGRDVATFEEEQLLLDYNHFSFSNWSGASWPPLIIRRTTWLEIGGFSVEFSPGMYSDPDFSMKMWRLGCRIFMGVGRSRIYHFQSRSTERVVKNNGRLQFMQKWGISSNNFYKHYLRMGQRFKGPLAEPEESVVKRARWAVRFKLFFNPK
jgi:glycosyltransferase involved in cell wall biosynthesis